MGSAEPFEEEIPLEHKIKCLPDEDLLEIWEESQQLETMLAASIPGCEFPAQNFETVIAHELSLRACRRLQAGGSG